MIKKIIPFLLILVALVAGAGGGLALRLSAPDAAGASPEAAEGRSHAKEKPHAKADSKSGHGEAKPEAAAYMKFSRQFVAPIVIGGEPEAMMILDVNIEIDPGLGDSIYAEEPKLRDAVLRVLLRQGSDGSLGSIFADPAVLEETRAQILEEARAIIGEGARSVLIMDVGYQKL